MRVFGIVFILLLFDIIWKEIDCVKTRSGKGTYSDSHSGDTLVTAGPRKSPRTSHTRNKAVAEQPTRKEVNTQTTPRKGPRFAAQQAGKAQQGRHFETGQASTGKKLFKL
ncbi:unnamed protein product [Meloidogyne enterolobii]|uniref:Uncharacterized protein n=1 Tax=Meloidogyne enterolobii TaxID=390850 RepID=A0ACB1B2E4_MELEN